MKTNDISWEGNEGSIEASDLGFRPGFWPAYLEIEKDGQTIVLLKTLHVETKGPDRELERVIYSSCVLRGTKETVYTVSVWND